MNKILFSLLSASVLVSGACAKSLADIKSSGTIRIAVHTDEPPFSKLTDGQYVGFEVDLAKALAKEIFEGQDGKIEFVPAPTNADALEAVKKDEADMAVATMVPTAETEKVADFSSPYFSVNVGVLTRKADEVKSAKDLANKTILGMPGSIGWIYFEKQGYKMQQCASSGECYKALRDNQGDAYADENIVVMAYPVIDRRVEAPLTNLGISEFNSVCTQKGNTELLDKIDEALVNLSKDGFFEAGFNNQINPYFKGTADKKYFLLDDLYSLF